MTLLKERLFFSFQHLSFVLALVCLAAAKPQVEPSAGAAEVTAAEPAAAEVAAVEPAAVEPAAVEATAAADPLVAEPVEPIEPVEPVEGKLLKRFPFTILQFYNSFIVCHFSQNRQM